MIITVSQAFVVLVTVWCAFAYDEDDLLVVKARVLTFGDGRAFCIHDFGRGCGFAYELVILSR